MLLIAYVKLCKAENNLEKLVRMVYNSYMMKTQYNAIWHMNGFFYDVLMNDADLWALNDDAIDDYLFMMIGL